MEFLQYSNVSFKDDLFTIELQDYRKEIVEKIIFKLEDKKLKNKLVPVTKLINKLDEKLKSRRGCEFSVESKNLSNYSFKCTISALVFRIDNHYDQNRLSINKYNKNKELNHKTTSNSPRCFYDVYNPEYDWQFKVKEISVTEKDFIVDTNILDHVIPKKIDITKSIQSVRINQAIDYSFGLVVGFLGLGVVGKVIGGIAGTVGLISSVFVLTPSQLIDKLNYTGNEREYQEQLKNHLQLNKEDILYSADLTSSSYWYCRVIYVLAKNAKVWVPCYSTFRVNKTDIITANVDYSGKHGIDTPQVKTQFIALSDNYIPKNIDKIIRGELEGELEQLQIPKVTEEEKNIAKVVFAQLYGDNTYWDTGERAESVTTLDVQGEVRDKGYLEYKMKPIFKAFDN